MKLLPKIRWPWDHFEVAQHVEQVDDRDAEVNRILREATAIKEQNHLGDAVAHALGEQRRKAL